MNNFLSRCVCGQHGAPDSFCFSGVPSRVEGRPRKRLSTNAAHAQNGAAAAWVAVLGALVQRPATVWEDPGTHEDELVQEAFEAVRQPSSGSFRVQPLMHFVTAGCRPAPNR